MSIYEKKSGIIDAAIVTERRVRRIGKTAVFGQFSSSWMIRVGGQAGKDGVILPAIRVIFNRQGLGFVGIGQVDPRKKTDWGSCSALQVMVVFLVARRITGYWASVVVFTTTKSAKTTLAIVRLSR